MPKLSLIFFIMWIVMFLVRLMRRSSLRAGARPGPGPWGQSRGPSSNHSQQASSPYEVLEIRPGASREEITAAYRRLVQQYHPDIVANLAPEFREVAERRMKEINAAYEQLKRHTSS